MYAMTAKEAQTSQPAILFILRRAAEPRVSNHEAEMLVQIAEIPIRLIRVTRRQIARDLRAFLDVAADRHRGGGRAGAVGLLKTVIAAVEAGDHTGAALAGGGLGVDQRLHFVAPLRPLVGAADAAQIVQRAEDFGEPLQVGVERRGVLRPRRRGGLRGLSIQAYVKNITNATNVQSGGFEGPTVGNDLDAKIIDPRLFGIELRQEF